MNVIKKLNIYLLVSTCLCSTLLQSKDESSGYTHKVRETAAHAAHSCKRKASNLWNNRTTEQIAHIKSSLKAHVAAMRDNIERVTLANIQLMNEWYDQCYEHLSPDDIESDKKLRNDMQFICDAFQNAIDETKSHLDEIDERSKHPEKTIGQKTAEVVDYSIETVKSGFESVKTVIHDATTPTTGQKIGEKIDEVKEHAEHKAEIIKKEAELAGKAVDVAATKTKHNTAEAVKEGMRAARDKVSEATK